LTQLNFLLRLLLFFSIVVVVIAMRVFTLLLISARSSYLDVIYNSLRTMALNMYELVVLFFNILDKLTTERNALKQWVTLVLETYRILTRQNVIMFSPHLSTFLCSRSHLLHRREEKLTIQNWEKYLETGNTDSINDLFILF